MLERVQLLGSKKDPERQFKVVGFSLFLLFAAICYWSMPSLAYQEWDSLVYAHAVENDPLPLGWGNHPLGNLIQSFIYRVALYLGYDGRALILLQIFNTLVTAASIAVFYVILVRRIEINIIPAVGWAAFFGSGYSMLSFAGTAEIYSIALLLLLIAWNSLLLALSRPESSRLFIAGLLIGLAGLSHQFSAILLAAGVLAACFYQTRRTIVLLGCTIFATLLIGYGLLGYLDTGSFALDGLYAWIKGYVGEPSYGRSLTLEGMQLAMTSGTQSVIKSAVSGLSPVRILVLGIIVFIFIALPFQRRLWTSRNIKIVIYCALPALIGLPLIIWWDPVLEGKFWLLIAPFFIALLTLSLPSNKRWARFIPVSLAVFTLFVNQLNGLRFEHMPDRVFEASLQAWIDNSSRSDVLYESNNYTAHLLYWGDRPRTTSAGALFYGNDDLNNPYRPLERVIEDAWARGASVLYTEGLNDYLDDDRLAVVGASREGLNAFFRSYHHEGPVFEYQEYSGGPVKQVFRLVPLVSQ